ncbi:MAG: hypothetical protein ACYTG7_21975, partial [Planctomycetota bacterium]
NIYVTGQSRGSSGKWDYATVMYSPDGKQAWVMRHHKAVKNSYAFAIAVNDPWNIYVTGECDGDYGTIRYSNEKLEVFPRELKAWQGGVSNFFLHAGAQYAGCNYLIVGGVSGNSPGTKLPLAGSDVLPVNWDIVSDLLIQLDMPTPVMGKLDANGEASAVFTLPPIVFSVDVTMTFAYAIQAVPWKASNYIEIVLLAP